MAVVIETTLGDITVDLFVKQRPTTCLNFLKLCKMKYYNFNLFHTIQSGFIAQTGDPTGEGTGGQSVFGLIEGPEKRFFSGEKMPKIRHADAGLLSMVSTGESMIGSQFFFTLGPDLDSLDGIHCVIGIVTEGQDVLRRLNDVICDETHRPYQDVRITHTVVLEDPFNDPIGMKAPSRSPSPSAERLRGGRIAPDEELDETQGKSTQEIQEIIEEKEAKARATILEIVGDLPDADVAPPENVLFVCKLNPVTTDEDLEIIFSRFGTIVGCEVIRDKKTGDSLQYAFIEFDDKKSCEDAYFKMDNVLIDDRRIHVDFSQSVSKMRWLGKGKGIRHFDSNGKEENKRSDKNYSHRNNRTDQKDYSRHERISDSRNERKSYKDDKTSDHRVDRRSEHRHKKSEYRQERKSDLKRTDSKHERRLDHSERERGSDRKKSRNSPSKNHNKIKDKNLDNTESSRREKSPSNYDRHKHRSERNSFFYKDSEGKRYERRSDGTDKRDRHEREPTNNRGYNKKVVSPDSNNTEKVYDKENCDLVESRKSNDNTSRENGYEDEKALASKMTLERFEKRKKDETHHEVVNKITSHDKNEDDSKNKHHKGSKNKSKSHKTTKNTNENLNDKKDNKLEKKSKKSKLDSSSTKKADKSKTLTDKTKYKNHTKISKKRKRESTSNSSSDSSSDSSSSSSDSSSSSSSDAKTKKKIKRKHSTSSSSSSSTDSSSSSSSDSSSDSSSSSSSDSDEPKKKKKKAPKKPTQKLKKK